MAHLPLDGRSNSLRGNNLAIEENLTAGLQKDRVFAELLFGGCVFDSAERVLSGRSGRRRTVWGEDRPLQANQARGNLLNEAGPDTVAIRPFDELTANRLMAPSNVEGLNGVTVAPSSDPKG